MDDSYGPAAMQQMAAMQGPQGNWGEEFGQGQLQSGGGNWAQEFGSGGMPPPQVQQQMAARQQQMQMQGMGMGRMGMGMMGGPMMQQRPMMGNPMMQMQGGPRMQQPHQQPRIDQKPAAEEQWQDEEWVEEAQEAVPDDRDLDEASTRQLTAQVGRSLPPPHRTVTRTVTHTAPTPAGTDQV